MTDPRFWISLGLSALLHASGFGGMFILWLVLHLGAARVETAPILLQPFGDSDAEGMKVATVSMDPGTPKEGAENTPGGSMDEDEPYRPATPTPVERPQESEKPPEAPPDPVVVVPEPTPEPPVIVPEPLPEPVAVVPLKPEIPVAPKPEPKSTVPVSSTTEAKKPTLTKATGTGVKGAGAPGGASMKPGAPTAGGRLGVTTGVRSSGIGKPEYPQAARAYKQQGTVILRLHISAEGKVLEVKLYRSSGYPLLDENALEFFGRTTGFSPATRDGVPVETIDYLHRVEYSLSDP